MAMGRGCGPRGWHGGRHGFGAGGWGRERGAGDGRGRRMFDGGELRLVLLKLIGDAPRHGYDLIREIETLTGGAYAPSPGIVYPTITLLDDMGLIEEVRAEGTKKLYAITEAGRVELEEKRAEIAALLARLAEVGVMAQRTDAGSVRRAMMNLRAVLQNRLGGEIDDATIHAVVAELDAAAQRIERL